MIRGLDSSQMVFETSIVLPDMLAKLDANENGMPQIWNCFDDDGNYYGQAIFFDREKIQKMDPRSGTEFE